MLSKCIIVTLHVLLTLVFIWCRSNLLFTNRKHFFFPLNTTTFLPWCSCVQKKKLKEEKWLYLIEKKFSFCLFYEHDGLSCIKNIYYCKYNYTTHFSEQMGNAVFVSVPQSIWCSFTANKIYCKSSLCNGPWRPEEQRYSYTLCLTSALDGGGWSMQCPVCSIPGKETQYPLYRRLGGSQGQSAQVWKISPPPAFDPRLSSP